MISDFDSLNISPQKDLFEIHQFYSNMKDSVISGEDYGNFKKFYKLLKMSNLGELNKIYNFQDPIILCEIFEQRSDLFKKYLNIIQESGIVLAASRAVYMVTKVSVVLHFQQMQSFLEFLKKH